MAFQQATTSFNTSSTMSGPAYYYPQYVYPLSYPAPYPDQYPMMYPPIQPVPQAPSPALFQTQDGQNAIKLDNASQKYRFRLDWSDGPFRDEGGRTMWSSSVYINGVLRGVGQASKKGHARDRAAEQALLNMNIVIGG